MKTQSGYLRAVSALRDATGVVIPVYLPAGVDSALAARLLLDTVRGCAREVARPEAICLAADGPGSSEAAAEAAARECGVRKVSTARNRGKLSALRAGMKRLMEEPGLKYLATVDQDGDHFPNELINLVRAAGHVEESLSADRVLVIGRRISRHRPLGFLRGELEELADRMLLDALQYHAAITGKPLRMQFTATLDEFPDFHSGFKLFSRSAAEKVFLSKPNLAGVSEECYYRHAVEAVLAVEVVLSGACIASVNRSTLDEQPVSSFGLLNRRQLVADKIIWPCKRLKIPAKFVAQWMTNHLPRLMLGSYLPDGREELLAIRRLVLKAFAVIPSKTDSCALDRPEFI